MSDLRDYEMPVLELRHLNGRGTGSALRLCLFPATDKKLGFIRLRMGNQFGKFGFDWSDSCCADLGAVELAKLLMVFQGMIDATVSDGSGDNTIHLYDKNGDITTVGLRHKVEPGPTYVLTVIAYVLHQAKTEIQIELSNAEALALSTAIQGALHTVAFGVPKSQEAA